MFTWNNPKAPSPLPPDWEPENPFPEADYVLFQLEKAPETGTMHYQGYVIIKSRPRFNALKTMYPKEIHWERRRGSHKQAVAYVSKDDTRIAGPWFFGTDEDVAPQPGARTDLESFRDAVREGHSLTELLDAHASTLARHPRFYDMVRAAMPQPRRLDLEVIVCWGPAEAGKSRWAYDTYPELYKMPLQSSTTIWFDGYTGQDTVLIDEFTGQMPLDTLLQLLDIYPTALPVKGSFTPLSCKRIIITSNSEWHSWYEWTGRKNGLSDRLEKRDALERRISKVIHFQAAPRAHRKPKQFVMVDGVLTEVDAPTNMLDMDFTLQ